jgi:hypothetical protein
MALKCETDGLLMIVCPSAADYVVPHRTSVQIAIPTCTSSHGLTLDNMRRLLHCLSTIHLRSTARISSAAAGLQSLVLQTGAGLGSNLGRALGGADDRQIRSYVHKYSTNAAQLFPEVQARLQAALQPAVCMQLPRQGYAVLDNVLGPSVCEVLRSELRQLHAQGRMHLNHTHLVRDNTTQLLPKAAIYEAEVSLDPQVGHTPGPAKYMS